MDPTKDTLIQMMLWVSEIIVHLIQYPRQKFLEVANTAGVGIDMYERFVDDSNLVSETIEAGWGFCKETGRLAFVKDKVPEDSSIEEDKRTSLVIKDIANSVHPMIQME